MEHLNIIPLCFGVAGLINLVILAIIDLRTWLLPDKLNLSLAILGIGFHIATSFMALEPLSMALGLLTGGGILYAVRTAGNWYYKQDTLGLGDVKLLAAAGLWLGPADVVMALTCGATAGLFHGIFVALSRAIKNKEKPNFHRLMIPAGPGFCIGIAIVGIWKFFTLMHG